MVSTIVETDKTHHVDLSPADTAAAGPELPDRKTGGPADRLDWLVSLAPAYGNAAFKLLTVLVKHSNSGGTCWPSRDLLMLSTGQSSSALDRGIAELKTGGAISVAKGRKVSTYHLSGAATEWLDFPKSGTVKHRKRELQTSRIRETEPYSSSNPQLNPKPRAEPKAVDVEPSGETTGVFTMGFEEERGTAKKSAAPPACADAEAVASWMTTYCPLDHRQSEAAPFALRMLQDYKAHWWAAPVGNRKGGWQSHMTPEMVAAHYLDNAERWQKFRADVADKLVRGGLPAMTATGELERENVWCNRCAAMIGAYDVGQVMKIGGRKEVDKCDACGGA